MTAGQDKNLHEQGQEPDHTSVDANASQHDATPPTQRKLDEYGLPYPDITGKESFKAFDHYANIVPGFKSRAISVALRGAKAFSENVTPEDFADDDRPNSKSVGIAELWFLSNWTKKDWASRDVGAEKAVTGVSKGDVLFVETAPKDLPLNNSWEEVIDLGIGFSNGFDFLPYTPYHDYDEKLIVSSLNSLRRGEHLECVVREALIRGCDGVPVDPNFCWRLYSCKVTVYKVQGD